MAVILHAAQHAVLAPDAVFHIVQPIVVFPDLPVDACFNGLQIFGIYQTFKGAARKRAQLAYGVAAKQMQKPPVCVDDLFVAPGAVDEKAAGDLVQKQQKPARLCQRVLVDPLFAQLFGRQFLHGARLQPVFFGKTQNNKNSFDEAFLLDGDLHFLHPLSEQ